MEYKPSSALILYAKKKFNPTEKIIIPEKLRKKTDDPEEELEEVEVFTRFANKILRARVTKPGRFIRGKLVIGNMVVHYNKNYTQAIIWGSDTARVTVQKKDVIEILDSVKAIDATYL